ncbi:MAG: cell wall-binding repeat-containing protein [Actinomycetota bacterium]|jgi:putative cell wall-binding protein|nr:cell wall-binding repeat-containing protein [Actinomycetota bacterium]
MRRHQNTVRNTALALLLFVLTLPLIATAGPPRGTDITRTRPHQVILRFEGDEIPTQAFGQLQACGYSPETLVLRRYNTLLVPVRDGQDAASVAERLSGIHGVRVAGPCGTVSVQENVPPKDPHYSGFTSQAEYLGPSTTYPHSIDMERVWNAALNGDDHTLNPYRTGVTVAVIDTGVNSTLREHTGEYVGIWDYVNNDNDPTDDHASRHGTLVASMMRANGDNGYGLVGTMYGSRNTVLVYKTVSSIGVGEDIDTMEAMMDAADRGARVINVSLGGRAYGDPGLIALWEETVDYCSDRGSLVVAAAGNNGGGEVLYPAAAQGSLAVSSISRTGGHSSFASIGPEIDVVAIGENIWGAYDPYGAEQTTSGASGTSFATPLVSGAAAFLLSCVPSRTPAQTISLFKSTAVDYPPGLGDGEDDEYGAGRADVWNAYQTLITSIPEQAPLSLSASTPVGLETTLSWSAGSGSGVFYRYGVQGGPAYLTDATSGRLPLPSDGNNTVFVEAFSNSRWAATDPTTLTVAPSSGLTSLASERLEGANRYATAAAVSQASHPGSASTVLLASGENWPDALSAGPLASAVSGPLLLTRPGSLPVETRDELLRLNPNEILFIGGDTAVSAEVAMDVALLLPMATIRRLGGVSRYGTAQLVANELMKRLGGSIPQNRAVIASGENYPDALSGSPMAAAAGWPVLLTRADTLPPETSQAMDQLAIDDTIVLGGTSAVSQSAASTLPSVRRIMGDTRYTTSRAIADWAHDSGVLDGDRIGLATGLSFPDALAAGAYLAAADSPVVLANSVTWDTAAWLSAHDSRFDSIVLLGGQLAVPHDTEFDAKAALRRP